MKECVVVLGMHRSGTSVLTGLVSLFGAYVGSDLMKPTEDNPKGYFENNKIYLLNEKILRENKASWDDFSFVVEDIEIEQFQQYVSLAKEIIQDDLKYVKRTIIKDPRICLLFPIWEQALKQLGINIKLIFAYRSPMEVAHSLQKRDEIPVEKGLMLWSHYFLQSELFSRNYDRMIVEYDHDFRNLPAFMDKIANFIGLEISDEINQNANDFYTPSLKHHQVTLDNISDDLPSYLNDLIKVLVHKDFEDESKFNEVRNEFNNSIRFYLRDHRRVFDNNKQLEKENLRLEERIIREEKDIERINKKLETEKNENNRIRRVLFEREADLSKVVDDFNLKKKREELLESRLVIGDEVFRGLIESRGIYNKIRKSTKSVYWLKLKKLLLPLMKKKNKRLLRDKSLVLVSGMFSPFYYLSRYPDVWESGVDPLDHYCRNGWKEGRNPSASFNTKAYLDLYPDVARSHANPLVHFIQYGENEGRALPKSSYTILNAVSSEKSEKGGQKKFKKYNGDRVFNEKIPTVLLVAHSAGDVIYGGERSFFDMVKAASLYECNVVVALPRRQLEIIQQLKQFSCTIIVFKYGWWKKNLPVDNQVVDIFSDILSKYDVSILHVNTIMLREVLQAAKQKNITSVIHIRELITGDETLTSLIGEEAEDVVSKVNDSSDYIIANSHETAKAYGRQDKISIIHNTVDVKEFDIRNDVGGTLRVGLISSNIDKKGVFEFLEIAEQCREEVNIEFLLIGPETKETKEIEGLIRQKDLNNLIFAGYRNTSLEAVSEVNIVLNISKFTESFGRTILEGMSARRPVIGYRWGALQELIVDGETGYLVPYMDVPMVVEKIKTLNGSRTLINKMGEKARKHAVESFGFDAYAKKVGDFYKKILEAPNSIDLHERESKRQKIAYFLWHFPVPSETFVLNELRVLVEEDYDVIVFCKQSPFPDFNPDFEISWDKVKSPEELAKKLIETERTIVHSHFTYPTVTNMVWPACEIAKINFTFIAHAQDIFRYENIKNNKIDEISRSEYCRNVFIPSRFHREYVIEQGVVPEKTLISPNGIDPNLYAKNRRDTKRKKFNNSVCAIHRYTEKKGLESLILSSTLINNKDLEIHIYGYGELEEQYLSLIKDNNLKNVHIHGAVKDRAEMIKVFSENDAFLCPSVRAEDGDMDGIPTVLMEAMAYGIPVISTDISGIPDLLTHKLTGFITESSPQGVAETINELYKMPLQQLVAISKAAKDMIYTNYNSIGLVNNLVRAWSDNNSLDIVIVSWNNLPELKEVIRRIQKYTLSSYNLLICDNNSQPEVKQYLTDLQLNFKNIKVFLNPDNSMVGPGSNIAIDMGSAEYIIYVCGKEGFVFDYLWEQAFIKSMDEKPKAGLGGTLCYSPTYLTGKEYPAGVRLFDAFRNKNFANDNPGRTFRHVQGGFFIIRRKMYDQIGGFSDAVKHDYTDVEYSYYAESQGWQLLSIKGMISLYNKSRPTIFSRLDESVRAMHPPTLEQLPLLEKISQKSLSFCNICEWFGENSKKRGRCPKCGSYPDDRTLYRYLAESTLTYRRLPAVAMDLPESLQDFWIKQFQGGILSSQAFDKIVKTTIEMKYGKGSMQLFYYNNSSSDIDKVVLDEASRLLEEEGVLLIHQTGDFDHSFDSVVETLKTNGLYFVEEVSFNSAVIQYGWNPLWVFNKKK